MSKLSSTILGIAVLLGGHSHAADLALQYSTGISHGQRAEIERDLEFLHTQSFADSSGNLASYVHAPQVTGNALENWLAERIHYILDARHPVVGSIEVSRSSAEYPALQATMGPVILATNVGTYVYSQGKKANELNSIDLQGIGKITVNTPHVGIMKLSAGYFSNILSTGVSARDRDFISGIFRLSTLFHEARHSDGNGSSLGFGHAVCPAGHLYAGKQACDTPANGPYRMGALVMESILSACQDCTPGQRDTLQVLINDGKFRVLSKLPQQATQDDDPFCGQFTSDINCATGSAAGATELWDDQPEHVL